MSHRGTRLKVTIGIALWALAGVGQVAAQNYERYKPLELPRPPLAAAELPAAEALPDAVEDDRELVAALEAVVIVDSSDRIVRDASIDDLEGLHYKFDPAAARPSLAYGAGIRRIVQRQLGKPITLRRINGLSRDIIQHYQDCGQPIVDVVIPEQRITTGTLHIVVIESRVGRVVINPGQFFEPAETRRWIRHMRPGRPVYEPALEDDLYWMNRNAFARVGVDFRKGQRRGTTDILFDVQDIRPIRGYLGVDDSGVETLNFGRFFAGFQYGNFLGRGGTLGYQFTADESFSLLEAHSVNFAQPISRDYSVLTYGSWAGVSPALGLGLSQDGESYQHGTILTRHLLMNRRRQVGVTLGYEFKATDNNLEFDGTSISESTADLFQLRFGINDSERQDIDQFRLFSLDVFIGPGGGLTGHHSAASFSSIRPGTSPDYIYARSRFHRQFVLNKRVLFSLNLVGQVASERLLFSETLGLGGFDSIRGTDQREFNADHGWIANIEVGPRTFLLGDEAELRTLRAYGFVDLGNGYTDDALAGEQSEVFVASIGIGGRLQVGDRFTARADYGVGLEPLNDTIRNDRFHFGLTWIPGRRWRR